MTNALCSNYFNFFIKSYPITLKLLYPERRISKINFSDYTSFGWGRTEAQKLSI